jgi:hypothetical protein
MPRRMPERSNDVTVYMVLNDYRTGAGRARQFRIARSGNVSRCPPTGGRDRSDRSPLHALRWSGAEGAKAQMQPAGADDVVGT